MPRKKTNISDAYHDVFPTRLRKLMDDNDVTHQTLGDAIGKPRQSIGGYADGSTLPNLNTVAEIAKFFGVSADYLLGLSEAPTRNVELSGIVDKTGLEIDAIIHLLIEKETDVGGDNYSDYLRFISKIIKHEKTRELVDLICVYTNETGSSMIAINGAGSPYDFGEVRVAKKAFFKHLISECFISIIEQEKTALDE